LNKRNYALDILKVIALMAIMLAHVSPSGFIFQLRNFDVPLMIMISVWLSLRTIKSEKFKYSKYIYSRAKRLIVPTWIFLTIYFFICYFKGEIISIQDIVMSYTMIDGIGYVWVIRIYIYVAIITPVIYKAYEKLEKWQLISLFGMIYCLYMLLIDKVDLLNGMTKLLITATIVDFIGYSFIVLIAIIIFNLEKKDVYKLGCLFGLIFFLLAVKNGFIQTQYFKYPLRLYYLSYAFLVSIFLYLFVDKLNQNNKLIHFKIIDFISKNSMWIYLWHILYIQNVNKLFLNSNLGYIYRFLLLLLLALATTYIQNFAKRTFNNLLNMYYKRK
jgi:peptidoglycan/LPS O-acetylase OafA/YrhL